MDVNSIEGAGITWGNVRLRAKTVLDVAPGYRLIQQYGVLLDGQPAPGPGQASQLTEQELGLLWTPWKRSTQVGEDFQLAIADADTDEFRGSLVLRSAGAGQLADVGYWVDPEHWGKGLGSGAVRLVLSWAFESLDPSGITASVQPENPRSRALLESLGFAGLGAIPGQKTPLLAYHLARAQWSQGSAKAPSAEGPAGTQFKEET